MNCTLEKKVKMVNSIMCILQFERKKKNLKNVGLTSLSGEEGKWE